MLVPKFPSIFRVTRHQRFDYKPIYYDEDKERQEKRAKELKEGITSGTGRIKFKPMGSSSLRNSNLRILMLVVLLSALAVYIIAY